VKGGWGEGGAEFKNPGKKARRHVGGTSIGNAGEKSGPIGDWPVEGTRLTKLGAVVKFGHPKVGVETSRVRSPVSPHRGGERTGGGEGLTILPCHKNGDVAA